MEDSSPARTRVSIDLNMTPMSGLSTAPSSKGGHRPPTVVLPVPRNLFGEMQDPYTQTTPGLTREDGEGFMANMINEDGQASYVHLGDELYEEDDEVEVQDDPHIDDMPMFMDELTQQAKSARKNTKRGAGFTEAEDECLCDTWMEVGQNTIVGAEMKGNAYLRRMYKNYHERALLHPYSMVTTRTEASIQKRFGLISAECSKFTGSFEHAVARPQSGIGIGDLAFQALKVYKAEHGGKSFNFAHCYRKLKDNQKWKDLHNALKKGVAVPGGVPPMATGHTADGTTSERPRGRTNSKLDLKRDATTIALQETLKGFITRKDKTSDKKDERDEKKRREREEVTKNYFIVQTKKLEIEEENAKIRAMEAATRAMEAENKKKEVELALAAQEAQIMAMDLSRFTPRKKAYYEKKQERYMEGEG
ncbi:hypothetical protein ZWY2020_000143 [Hordeum vulgare]|nr:hypothetical protein ZWY2020_000143 [Hordeum vulgare]